MPASLARQLAALVTPHRSRVLFLVLVLVILVLVILVLVILVLVALGPRPGIWNFAFLVPGVGVLLERHFVARLVALLGLADPTCQDLGTMASVVFWDPTGVADLASRDDGVLDLKIKCVSKTMNTCSYINVDMR